MQRQMEVGPRANYPCPLVPRRPRPRIAGSAGANVEKGNAGRIVPRVFPQLSEVGPG
jgi:hypothetical protein